MVQRLSWESLAARLNGFTMGFPPIPPTDLNELLIFGLLVLVCLLNPVFLGDCEFQEHHLLG